MIKRIRAFLNNAFRDALFIYRRLEQEFSQSWRVQGACSIASGGKLAGKNGPKSENLVIQV